MQYLTFHKFISQDVLIITYYMMALLIPIFLWQGRKYVLEKIPFLRTKASQLKFQDKMKLWLSFFLLFLCMELCLRMVFEAMIGYFDMHNYLYEISHLLRK